MSYYTGWPARPVINPGAWRTFGEGLADGFCQSSDYRGRHDRYYRAGRLIGRAAFIGIICGLAAYCCRQFIMGLVLAV